MAVWKGFSFHYGEWGYAICVLVFVVGCWCAPRRDGQMLLKSEGSAVARWQNNPGNVHFLSCSIIGRLIAHDLSYVING